MLITGRGLSVCCLTWAAVCILGMVSAAEAQTGSQNLFPCGHDSDFVATFPEAQHFETWFQKDQPIRTQGLFPADDEIVFDANQNVCWLVDANLAGDPEIRALMGVSGINPDGTMDFATSVNWVNALNSFDHGRGYLGHNDWQLPNTPLDDKTCSSFNNGNFGATCTGSALGNLYGVGLARTFPDSVVTHFNDIVFPFLNLQPGLYWTTDSNSGGQQTFSFNTNLSGANTTKYNYFHVLPMVHGAIGTPPSGSGVLLYLTGDAAFKAVYDSNTDTTWALDANLPAVETFGITGTTTITSDVNGGVLTVPLIDRDGAMLFDTAHDPSAGWIAAMRTNNYAGSDKWRMPALADLQQLFLDLAPILQPGDVKLEERGKVGPFQHLQPGFYWACERDPGGNSESPCDFTLFPGLSPDGTQHMQYSFNLDNGFEGTDLPGKQFYVMVYFPADSRCGGSMECK